MLVMCKNYCLRIYHTCIFLDSTWSIKLKQFKVWLLFRVIDKSLKFQTWQPDAVGEAYAHTLYLGIFVWFVSTKLQQWRNPVTLFDRIWTSEAQNDWVIIMTWIWLQIQLPVHCTCVHRLTRNGYWKSRQPMLWDTWTKPPRFSSYANVSIP